MKACPPEPVSISETWAPGIFGLKASAVARRPPGPACERARRRSQRSRPERRRATPCRWRASSAASSFSGQSPPPAACKETKSDERRCAGIVECGERERKHHINVADVAIGHDPDPHRTAAGAQGGDQLREFAFTSLMTPPMLPVVSIASTRSRSARPFTGAMRRRSTRSHDPAASASWVPISPST